MHKHHQNVTIGVVVVVALVISAVAGYRAWRGGAIFDAKSSDGPRLSTSGPSAETAITVPLEHRAKDMKFDIVPEQMGVQEAAITLGKLVRQSAGASLSPEKAESLASLVSERWALLISPDYDKWLAAGRAYGLDVSESEPTDAENRKRWKRTTQALLMAPVASEGVLVRVQDSKRRYPFSVSAPGVFMRAGTGRPYFDYPKPPESTSDSNKIEVVIPLRYSESDSSAHQQPAMGIMRLYWDDRKSAWQPYDWMIFMDHSGSGKTFPMPIL